MTRIVTHANIHCATKIDASTKTGVVGCLKLQFTTGNWCDGCAEYNIFLGDPILADRLATAINEIGAARKAEIEAEKEQTDTPINEYVHDDGQFGVGA